MDSNCPNCNTELLYFGHDVIDDEGDYINRIATGHCDCCGKDFQWKESFILVEAFEDLQEIS